MTTMAAARKIHKFKEFISENPGADFLFSYTLPIKKKFAHNSDF